MTSNSPKDSSIDSRYYLLNILARTIVKSKLVFNGHHKLILTQNQQQVALVVNNLTKIYIKVEDFEDYHTRPEKKYLKYYKTQIIKNAILPYKNFTLSKNLFNEGISKNN